MVRTAAFIVAVFFKEKKQSKLANYTNCQATAAAKGLKYKSCSSTIDFSRVLTINPAASPTPLWLESVTFNDVLGHAHSLNISLGSQANPYNNITTFFNDLENVLADIGYIRTGVYTFAAGENVSSANPNPVGGIMLSNGLTFNFKSGVSGGTIYDLSIGAGFTSCEEHDISYLIPHYSFSGFTGSYFAVEADNTGYVDGLTGVSFTDTDSLLSALSSVTNRVTGFDLHPGGIISQNDPNTTTIYPGNGLYLVILKIPTNAEAANGSPIYKYVEAYVWTIDAIPAPIPSATITQTHSFECNSLDKIELIDTTKAYHADTNPTGYGGPNYPAIADIASVNIYVYDQNDVFIGGNSFNYQPNAFGNAILELPATDLGIGIEWEPDFIYKLKYELVMSNSDTYSCGTVTFTIEDCPPSNSCLKKVYDCIMNKSIAYSINSCSGGCATDDDYENKLMRLLLEYYVLEAKAKSPTANCVKSEDCLKLLEKCQNLSMTC